MRPKTDAEIDAMRQGGTILAQLLDAAFAMVEPGITTKAIAEALRPEFKTRGAVPTFLGYEGFPDVACMSVNEAVVHGIPDARRELQSGDVISIDLGVTYKGMIVDGARSAIVGNAQDAPARTRELLDYTRIATETGINAISDGVAVGTIGAAIQAVLDAHHLGIVRDLVGHGVGHSLHEDPNIPNYGINGSGTKLRSGMTVAIEPMATLGGWQVSILPDGWTVVTRDGSLAAHFEHTVLVTDDGAEILTSE